MFGSDNATATLFVHEQLKIVDKPKDQQVLLGQTVCLDCRSNVQNALFNITTTWMKEGKGEIDFNRSYPHYRQLQNNSLIVSNATVLDTGLYKCFVQANDRKYIYASANAEAALTVAHVPDAPEITHLLCKSRGSYIEFRSQNENGYPILFYRIEYNTSFEPEIWNVAMENVTQKRFGVSLSPWTNYTFRVFAYNRLGASPPSNLSDVCCTTPATPERNPDNVKGQSNADTEMTISWNPMPKIQHNGPNFMYVVQWGQNNGNCSDWHSKNISDWETGEYLVKNIPSFKKYCIRVRAVNGIGKAETPADIVFGYVGMGEAIEKVNWVLPVSTSLAAVIVALAIGLILIRRYYRKALINQEEIDSFFEGIESEKEQNIAHKMPYDKERYEVDIKSIKFDKEGMLGSGELGLVCRGTLERGGCGKITVAIKMVNPNKIRRSTITGLLSEIKILAFVGKHVNITELIGANTSEVAQGKVYILLEICPLGSLEKYLRGLRPAVDAQFGDLHTECTGYSNLTEMKSLATTPLDPSLCQDLYRWSQEICNGMAFLAIKHVVHADLATRNILLGTNKEAKICDFGLSRRMYNYASYVKSQQEPLPWKWMAPESLRVHEFNEKTDVWAFGVTLWEMYSLGDSPYQGLSWDQNFVQMLQSGFPIGTARI